MLKMSKMTILLLFIAGTLYSFDGESVLPRPQEIKPLRGRLPLSEELILHYPAGDLKVQWAVEHFLRLLRQEYDLRIRAEEEAIISGYQLFLHTAKDTPANLAGQRNVRLESDHEEGYALLVRESGVRLVAKSAQGLHWGLMTLFLLVRKDASGSLLVPAVRISDWPHYRWRGYMLDTGRSPYSVAQIKRTIRICSVFKLNFLIIREGDDELNAFRYRHLPLGHKNPYALKISDLQELIDYGQKHGIAVLFEIESLGHAGAKSLYYPDLVEGGIYNEYWPGFSHRRKANLKVNDARTYQLLENIYDELFPLLKTSMVHLGLDEVRLPEEEQAQHMQRLLPIVDRVGKRYGRKMQMIVWSDAPPTPKNFEERVIRCLWVYDSKVDPNNKYARQQGLDVLTQSDCRQKVFMAGGSGTHHQPYSKGDYHGAFLNLASWAMLGEKYSNFIGLLAVQWSSNIIDEWLPNFLMAADFGWKVPAKIPEYARTMKRIGTNLQKLQDFISPDPDDTNRPAWDGLWLNGRYWDEDIMTGKKAAPVLEIQPAGFYFQKESPLIHLVCNFPEAKIYYTLDGSEPTKQSTFYFEPFRVNETVTVRARAFLPGRPASYIVTEIFGSLNYQDPPKHGKLNPGLQYDYFKARVNSVLELPDLKADTSGTIDQFAIAACADGEEAFAFIFKGYIRIAKKGIYTFHLLSNDGSKLYVNGKELINNDGLHGAKEVSGKIALKSGAYPIKLMYFQAGGTRALRLSWQGPGIPKQEVPASVLFH